MTLEGPDLAVNPGVWMTGWPAERALPVVQRLARIGYRLIVVVLRDPYAFETAPVRELIKTHGLRVMTNTNQLPDADVASADPQVRARGLARLRCALDRSVELGSDVLTGVVYGPLGRASGPVSRPAFERTARLLGAFADEAAARGVRLLVEVVNRYETALLNTAGQARDFVEASGSDHLGIHLDVFHLNIEEDDIVAAIVATLPRLGYLELGQNHRGELGRGHIPLAEVAVRTLAAGYRGRFGLEAFTRSALAPEHANGLAIWRDVLDLDTRIAEDAYALLADAYVAAAGG